MMATLTVSPNLKQADDVYALLLAAHEGLSDAASATLNARLILILANHIGEETVLAEAIALAGRAGSRQRCQKTVPPSGW